MKLRLFIPQSYESTIYVFIYSNKFTHTVELVSRLVTIYLSNQLVCDGGL